MDSNNQSPEDIRILRWDGSWWTKLETQTKGRDGNYTYYGAKTDILSAFAITVFLRKTKNITCRNPQCGRELNTIINQARVLHNISIQREAEKT